MRAILYLSATNTSLRNEFCLWNLLQIAIKIPILCLFCKYSKLVITTLHHENCLFNAVHSTLLQPSRGRSASRSPRSRCASRSRSPVMSYLKKISYRIARNFHANLICTCWQVRSDWAREPLRWWATITRERRDLRTCTTITMVWMILLLPLHPLIWEVSSYLVFNNYIILLKRALLCLP